MSSRSAVLVLVMPVLALVHSACTDRAPGIDGGAAWDAEVSDARAPGPHDAGAMADAPPDAPMIDAADDGGLGDAEVPRACGDITCASGEVCRRRACVAACRSDADCDGGTCERGACRGMPCEDEARDCDDRESCWAGRCIPDDPCCERGGTVCPEPAICMGGEGICACVSTCCSEGCAQGEVCSVDACACVPEECDPECAPGWTCVRGTCRAECESMSCPEGSRCDPARGCVPEACSPTECATRALRCDPESGCYEPCDRPDLDPWVADCAARGGTCLPGGYCSTTQCLTVDGAPLTGCRFVRDDCGSYHCLPDTQGAPVCDPSRAPEPPPDPRLCFCRAGGGCFDARTRG